MDNDPLWIFRQVYKHNVIDRKFSHVNTVSAILSKCSAPKNLSFLMVVSCTLIKCPVKASFS